MNLESLVIDQSVMNVFNENKTFKFAKLYKSAAEKNVLEMETTKSNKVKKLNKNSQSEQDAPQRSRSPNKNKKKRGHEKSDVSNAEAVEEESSKSSRSSRKSSPINKHESLDNSVKSIMKNKSNDIDSLLNVSSISTSSTKPKKRNKSVSFMLDDTDDVIVKRSKSSTLGKESKNSEKEVNKEKGPDYENCKQKKKIHSKENHNLKGDIKFGNKENIIAETTLRDKGTSSDVVCTEELSSEGNKKEKKIKKSKAKTVEPVEDKVNGEQSSENTSRKLKKQKRKAKFIQDGNVNAEDEPAVKTRKKDLKPEVIAKGLENLNIGDNAHTLTNLLDEMTVVDRNAKKKERQKQKKHKGKKNNPSEDNEQKILNQGTVNEEKEKVKWVNRKWNKDIKGDSKPHLHTSVVVENLPINIMCSYKPLLSEHFSKCGTIAGIGVAEAYPMEDLKPVFTTTVFFHEERAVAKALEEDNTKFQGTRIRVRRPHPPTETTLVVHSYSLSDQALSSLFSSAGRIRAIRLLVKGKKAMPSAFVEFDGPAAVERALEIAKDATTINGKKMYVSKFEIRQKGQAGQSRHDSMNDDANNSSTK